MTLCQGAQLYTGRSELLVYVAGNVGTPRRIGVDANGVRINRQFVAAGGHHDAPNGDVQSLPGRLGRLIQ